MPGFNLVGQNVPGADGQCYGLDLANGLGTETVESATVRGQEVALTLTPRGLDLFNHLLATCDVPRESCQAGRVAVVASSHVVYAWPMGKGSFGGEAIPVTGQFTTEQLAAIADDLSTGR